MLAAKDTFFYQKNTINVHGKLINLSNPKVMGVINITPDSFYDGGKLNSKKDLLDKVKIMISEGVDIIDVGGYSSRPGANEITENEELNRTIPAIKAIKKSFPDIVYR